jgi:hypothetical protein
MEPERTEPESAAPTRSEKLDEEIRRKIKQGFQVSHRTTDPPTVQMVKPKQPTAWKAHVIMCILTLGLWLLVWIPWILLTPSKREKSIYLEADSSGRVRQSKRSAFS